MRPTIARTTWGASIAVFDTALHRLRPGGVVVANYALLDRAVLGWQRLGSMAHLAVSRGVSVSETGVRLAAENPVFVCWGPSGSGGRGPLRT
jgi:precorrin-6B methylase 2